MSEYLPSDTMKHECVFDHLFLNVAWHKGSTTLQKFDFFISLGSTSIFFWKFTIWNRTSFIQKAKVSMEDFGDPLSLLEEQEWDKEMGSGEKGRWNTVILQ